MRKRKDQWGKKGRNKEQWRNIEKQRDKEKVTKMIKKERETERVMNSKNDTCSRKYVDNQTL